MAFAVSTASLYYRRAVGSAVGSALQAMRTDKLLQYSNGRQCFRQAVTVNPTGAVEKF